MLVDVRTVEAVGSGRGVIRAAVESWVGDPLPIRFFALALVLLVRRSDRGGKLGEAGCGSECPRTGERQHTTDHDQKSQKLGELIRAGEPGHTPRGSGHVNAEF